MKQTKDDPDGTPGGKTADMKCMDTMQTNDYHGDGQYTTWGLSNKATVPEMWRDGKIVNEEFKKSEFEKGHVKDPDRRHYLQQFKKKGFINSLLLSDGYKGYHQEPADNPAQLEHIRKLAKYPKPVVV